jgi:hypothetical protein
MGNEATRVESTSKLQPSVSKASFSSKNSKIQSPLGQASNKIMLSGGIDSMRLQLSCMSCDERISALNELQQTHGNHYVQRLVQAKMQMAKPGDRYEKEADKVTDRVMSIPQALHRQEDDKEEVSAKPLSNEVSSQPLLSKAQEDEKKEIQSKKDERKKTRERSRLKAMDRL